MTHKYPGMFINERFLLHSDAAAELYCQHAAPMPIIDFHNHLDPRKIAEDACFSSLTELWLAGDHYKWRAMRANGVDESFITGDAGDREKFMQWAATVPYTLRNPLYHWTHLELVRYFGITELLDEKSGAQIYQTCNALLKKPEFSVRELLRRMRVQVLCTTDDPTDSLEWHARLAGEDCGIRVFPTWRPDRLLAVEDADAYRGYLRRLSEVSGTSVRTLSDLFYALSLRQAHFAGLGCRSSDHGVGCFPEASADDAALEVLFDRLVRQGESLTERECDVFRAGMLYRLAEMNHAYDWAQQFHIGALRNNNRRLYRQAGPDIGCDSIGDDPLADRLSRFFGQLDDAGKLTRTVLYNLNPKDAAVLATMAANFNDGSRAGKMQYGAAWWFLDQLDGIRSQLETVSQFGLLSRFVGMLTDSRSFLSFPRHEYFRRILCDMLGGDLERGLIPVQMRPFVGEMVEGICCRNAERYFRFNGV